MQYKIVADSSADLRSLTSQIPFSMVPLKIIAGQEEFVDNETLDVGQMVAFLSEYKGRSGSACPSVADYLEAFGEAERIFCFTITSNLSGSFNAARLAKEDYEAAHPDRKVYVVDSLSAGAEIKLLAEKAEELILAGTEHEVICEALEAYQQKTGLMFSLESLRNLANNGRVSPVVAKIAGVLGIRAVGRASAEGTLELLDKCRGEKKALQKLLERMTEQGYKGGRVLIDHCQNLPAAEALREMILQGYPNTDVVIGETYGLCSFYAELGGLLVGYEKDNGRPRRYLHRA